MPAEVTCAQFGPKWSLYAEIPKAFYLPELCSAAIHLCEAERQGNNVTEPEL